MPSVLAPLRIVPDTNTLVSGLLWRGPPRRVFDAGRQGHIIFYTTPALLEELRGVLERPKFAGILGRTGITAQQLQADYTALAIGIVPAQLPAPVAADPDDDAVLACAVAAHAHAIVSGDHHLLDLVAYADIPILTAPVLLAQIAAASTSR